MKFKNDYKYHGDSRYEKIYEQMQLLGIQDVTTSRQNNNNTNNIRFWIHEWYDKRKNK